MAARRGCFFALGVLVLCAASAGWSGEASLSSHFAAEPDGTLIRQLEAGPGFSLALPDTPADVLAGRWRLSIDSRQVVAEDPATGLRIAQRRNWKPDLRLLFIEATLTNGGKAAVSVAPRVADWSFRVAAPAEASGTRFGAHRYEPLTYRDNDTWYGSTYWTGPDWTRVGKDWHHPGTNTPSVRLFTAPRDGRLSVTGRVCKAHLDGDGVRVAIRHLDRTVWQAELEGKDAKGVEPNLSLDVRKGDPIRFIVHKRIEIFCDTTHWDPIVTYSDGSRCQASASFGAQQGQGGWRYEMEVDPRQTAGLPTLYAFWPDSALREEPARVGGSVAFSQKDALPMFVLADGSDRSGIALAILGTGPWRLVSSLAADGRLRVELAVGNEKGLSLKPGDSVQLPRLVLGAYGGSWYAGAAALQRLLGSAAEDVGVAVLRDQIRAAFRRVAAPTDEPASALIEAPELDLWAMVQADWRQQDKLANSVESYIAATQRTIDKARLLLNDLRKDQPPDFLAAEAAQLERLADLAQRPTLNLDGWRSLYLRARWLKRQIALANPLVKFDKLLFAKRVPTSYSHLVMQYFGWRARPGGGLFILEKPGRSLACRDILDGKLAGGNVLEPRLSYDAKRIVFSFVSCTGKAYSPSDPRDEADERYYHIYEVNADGTGLRQLTSGPYDDLMPNYLPDGGIVFCSTRRKGHARCFGAQFSPRWHVYTLHRMDADGGNIRTLSFHETNEWFPAVSPTGHILYSRWDYVDRHPVLHQNLWACRPDGTNPVALWGNHTETPHCTFQLQPIPGTTKVVFTASAHHSITGGSIAIVDPKVGNNGEQALTRITPEICFPEAEGRPNEYYDSPWPLSERHFLVAYSPKTLIFEPAANDPAALGIYLLDSFGNRELIYRDPAIGSTNPTPLLPRPVPPVLGSTVPPDAPPSGELALLDVYEGLGDVPRGTIKALRILQILPKILPVADGPRIGLAGQEPARAVLGTVPVEPDGSAYFTVPAQKPILLQAIDAAGFAYQTMRSITYLQPGERATCIGCHERRTTTPGNASGRALLRPPSEIEPGPDGCKPFSFVRLVQPVFDKHCVRCHSVGGTSPREPSGQAPSRVPPKGIDLTSAPHEGFTRSYWSLCKGPSYWQDGTNPKNATEGLVPRYGGWNSVHLTTPGGAYGARGSRLVQMLLKGHNDVKLDADAIRRLAIWIDANSVFYGTYDLDDQARQLRGEVVAMPAVQ